MDDKKLHTLLTLLDDPDDSVFRMVEQEILKEDVRIVEKLEQIWETSLDELIQSRIENLIQQIQFNDTKEQIKKWSTRKTLDLFEGFFLISRYQYPDLRLKSITAQLDKITKDIWIEFNNSLTALEKITIVNHIIYDVHKFSINHHNIGSPQNCYLNQLLETQKGNPVSIAILYVLISRKLNLPVYFIDFPRNPLLAYFDQGIAELAMEQNTGNPILFYINPSNKGAIVGKREIDYFIQKNEAITHTLVTTPCPDKTIIRKLLEALIQSYEELGFQDKVGDLREIVLMLYS
ncbi:MAG: transglutaminase-like domain-containing protein [Prolixibacteraceae bacterium]|jgi:hypothetical protein|nr:transglutaminase-like domain-containing protein [Prolixibacteraceae bacterium]